MTIPTVSIYRRQVISQKKIRPAQTFCSSSHQSSKFRVHVLHLWLVWKIATSHFDDWSLCSPLSPSIQLEARLHHVLRQTHTHIYIYILIGGLEHEFYDFPYIGNNNPNWLSFFQRGRYTTNQICICVSENGRLTPNDQSLRKTDHESIDYVGSSQRFQTDQLYKIVYISIFPFSQLINHMFPFSQCVHIIDI